jgi:hypothetical protein
MTYDMIENISAQRCSKRAKCRCNTKLLLYMFYEKRKLLNECVFCVVFLHWIEIAELSGFVLGKRDHQVPMSMCNCVFYKKYKRHENEYKKKIVIVTPRPLQSNLR